MFNWTALVNVCSLIGTALETVSSMRADPSHSGEGPTNFLADLSGHLLDAVSHIAAAHNDPTSEVTLTPTTRTDVGSGS